jgi:O-antigen ligase
MASRAVANLNRPLLGAGGATGVFLLLCYLAYHQRGYGGFVLLILVIGALAVAYLACQIDPAWIFSAAIVAFIFNGNWSLLGLPSLVAPDRFLAAVAIVSLLFAGRAAQERPKLRFEGIHRLLAVVILYAAGSALISGTLLTQSGGYKLLDRLGVLPFVLFLLAPMAFRTARQRTILLCTLVGLGAYLGLTALFETTGPHALVFPRYILDENVGLHAGHARGPFVEAEANGVALFGCAVACAIAVVTWRRFSARLLAASIALLCGLDCLFTLQRAVWIGATAGAVLALMAFSGVRRYLVPIVVGLAVAVVLSLSLVPGLQQNVSERQKDQLSVWDRQNLNDAAMRMIAARPLVGFGWDRFSETAEPYFRQRSDIPLTSSNGPKGTNILHSVVLSNAVELGLIGCALWLIALLIAVGGAIVKRGPPELLPWRVGLAAFATCWVVVLNLTPLPQAFPNLLLWMWAGVVVSWRYWPAGDAAAQSAVS